MQNNGLNGCYFRLRAMTYFGGLGRVQGILYLL